MNLPDITCGEKCGHKCEIHGRPCAIVVDHSHPEKAAAIKRSREELIAMGKEEWIHNEDSTHYCNLCTIERKNGFPAGMLNDKAKAKYWVKKDRQERRRARKQAKARNWQMPKGSPIKVEESEGLGEEE